MSIYMAIFLRLITFHDISPDNIKEHVSWPKVNIAIHFGLYWDWPLCN